MKIQVQIQVSDIKNLYCDVGQISESWTDADGKNWIFIDVDADKQDEIKKLLFKKTCPCICRM